VAPSKRTLLYGADMLNSGRTTERGGTRFETSAEYGGYRDDTAAPLTGGAGTVSRDKINHTVKFSRRD
jgi:hypothetical protein